ncbi:helix-turn-helix domain-containing protein [Streptomyces pacificus]|uniref:Helix-turn-helix domain-containing protein n=1 Tax=Streptomyces pacificus TaxID=2705029 RepID=A0A6A0AW97_9ACTN|nr:helix-turn-helix domain-containing protein [Streptomyces pacificus]GFH36621.1 helix-turn-helix domain-containing protein [Streptomyces pacificus]
MARGRPVTDEDYEAVRRMHAEGQGRNAIARALKRSGRTISKIADELDLTFDRADEVRAATEVRQADLAALRAKLALDLTYDAMKVREQMWSETVVYNFGGKDNTYSQHRFDEAPADVKRSLSTTLGVLVEKSLKLSPPENDVEGLAAVDAWLKGMMGGS